MFLISALGQAIWLFPVPGNILRQKLPEITDAFHEIHRVLKPNGYFFLSDPVPNENDAGRFVDAYMQMKKDGHIKFYTKKSG